MIVKNDPKTDLEHNFERMKQHTHDHHIDKEYYIHALLNRPKIGAMKELENRLLSLSQYAQKEQALEYSHDGWGEMRTVSSLTLEVGAKEQWAWAPIINRSEYNHYTLEDYNNLPLSEIFRLTHDYINGTVKNTIKYEHDNFVKNHAFPTNFLQLYRENPELFTSFEEMDVQLAQSLILSSILHAWNRFSNIQEVFKDYEFLNNFTHNLSDDEEFLNTILSLENPWDNFSPSSGLPAPLLWVNGEQDSSNHQPFSDELKKHVEVQGSLKYNEELSSVDDRTLYMMRMLLFYRNLYHQYSYKKIKFLGGSLKDFASLDFENLNKVKRDYEYYVNNSDTQRTKIKIDEISFNIKRYINRHHMNFVQEYNKSLKILMLDIILCWNVPELRSILLFHSILGDSVISSGLRIIPELNFYHHGGEVFNDVKSIFDPTVCSLIELSVIECDECLNTIPEATYGVKRDKNKDNDTGIMTENPVIHLYDLTPSELIRCGITKSLHNSILYRKTKMFLLSLQNSYKTNINILNMIVDSLNSTNYSHYSSFSATNLKLDNKMLEFNQDEQLIIGSFLSNFVDFIALGEGDTIGGEVFEHYSTDYLCYSLITGMSYYLRMKYMYQILEKGLETVQNINTAINNFENNSNMVINHEWVKLIELSVNEEDAISTCTGKMREYLSEEELKYEYIKRTNKVQLFIDHYVMMKYYLEAIINDELNNMPHSWFAETLYDDVITHLFNNEELTNYGEKILKMIELIKRETS